MKLGITAYSSQTGLGYQTLDYYNHLNPDKVMQIDLSSLNGKRQNPEWYPDSYIVEGYPRPRDIRNWLKGLDVVLFAETPLNYDFYQIAKQMGVKTATVINYEFFDHYDREPDRLPDMIIMPSTWHFEEVKEFGEPKGVEVIQLHHPVDREQFPYLERTSHKMLHIAGNPAAHDRNGTWYFMQSCPDGRVTTQDEHLANRIRKRYRHSDVFTGIDDPNYMYNLGDIMVLPRRYGGNCLPLNEALSTGMPVIMPDITPNNDLLPKEWLVPAKKVGTFTPRVEVNLYSVDRHELTAKIKEAKTWDIEAESQKANDLADTISWETLKPEYLKALKSLI